MHRSIPSVSVWKTDMLNKSCKRHIDMSNRILVIHTANSSVTYSHCETMRW